MCALRSPRHPRYDAWREPAHALLKTIPKISHVACVLISAIVLHGPDKFFEIFGGETNPDMFGQKMQTRRNEMYTSLERIPTGVAVLCMKAASNLANEFSKCKQSGVDIIKLLSHSMHTSTINDQIGEFRELSYTNIEALVKLILTMAQWNAPRALLLCANHESGTGKHHNSELDIMAGMYECEPSEEEKNQQVVEQMVDTAHSFGASCLEKATKLVQYFRGAPVPQPTPQREWADVMFDTVLYCILYYAYAHALLHVCKTWNKALNANVIQSGDRIVISNALRALDQRPQCNWDSGAMCCLFVVTRLRSMRNMFTLILFVGIMSMQLAADWHRLKFLDFYMYLELQECLGKTEPGFCVTHVDTLKYFASFIYMIFVRFFIAASLLDIIYVLVMRLRNLIIVNLDDIVDHTPHCFYMCALYAVADRLHSPIVPSAYIHVMKMLVFGFLGLRYFAPQIRNANDKPSSRKSMYVARCICLFVFLTELAQYDMTGTPNWVILSLRSYKKNVWLLYCNLAMVEFVETLVSAFYFI